MAEKFSEQVIRDKFILSQQKLPEKYNLYYLVKIAEIKLNKCLVSIILLYYGKIMIGIIIDTVTVPKVQLLAAVL